MADFCRRGRIKSDQRDTNYHVPILGANIAAPPDLAANYNDNIFYITTLIVVIESGPLLQQFRTYSI